jgi:hypothetical protein
MSSAKNRDPQSQSQSQRRKQGQTDSDSDPNRAPSPRRDGRAIRSQPLRTDGAHCPERDWHRSGSTALGGILGKSIAELDDQLAEIEADLQFLQRKRDRLQTRRDRAAHLHAELERSGGAE